MKETVESLIAYSSENGRICPKPKFWNQLWEMLPNREREGAGWKPSLPLILAADGAPALLKMLRVEEHIRWADEHNRLADVSSFLRNLREEDWHHLKIGGVGESL